MEPGTIGSQDADLTDSPVAMQFTTGSGSDWNLDSVELNLGRFEGAVGPAGGSIGVVLAADLGGLPGATLALFPSAAPIAAEEGITLAPTTLTILAPDTSYWIVASADVDDEYQWNFSEDLSETGLPGWSIGDASLGGYPAGDWTVLTLPAPPPGGPDVIPASLIQVNAAAVPEPSALAMIGLAASVGLMRRRRPNS